MVKKFSSALTGIVMGSWGVREAVACLSMVTDVHLHISKVVTDRLYYM